MCLMWAHWNRDDQPIIRNLANDSLMVFNFNATAQKCV